MTWRVVLAALLLSGCVGNLALLHPGDEIFTAAEVARLERHRQALAIEMWRLRLQQVPLCTEAEWGAFNQKGQL